MTVLLPEAVAAASAARKLPHVYHDPLRLCLYLPGSGEWESHMRIDRSFVPWTATWRYYFEEWLDSDDWKGGGEHPDPGEAETYNRRQGDVFADNF